jgi:glycosyltransferase involved in cell wall biosynthesis
VVNGLPFAARLVRRRGLLVLVHHVHRRQWQIIYPGLPGRLGWFVESVLTPWLYRGTPHVTVSNASREDLVGIGVPRRLVRVVRNGLDPALVRSVPPEVRSAVPRLCVLSRLVPHKQIEHTLEVLAALRDDVPGLRLDVVGDGWWRGHLEERAAELAVTDVVTFHGHVDENEKHRLLAAAWVALLPSVKEGWGLVVLEAAAAGTPTVGYRSAGGVGESVVDGTTGVLVDDVDGMTSAVRRLLDDPAYRARLGEGAQLWASRFDWMATGRDFEAALSGRRS